MSSESFSIASDSDNLALCCDVGITVSVPEPTGGGARDPRVLLNDTAHCLQEPVLDDFDPIRTYDTYDGQNAAAGPDWYALTFPTITAINCVEMTMGLPYQDGGWWTSLAVETSLDGETWVPVERLRVEPPYDFADEPGSRLPYTTHVLRFEDAAVRAVRIIGAAGGTAQFTSLARLAVYLRRWSRWSPLDVPPPPIPRVLRLIQPQLIYDLSEHFVRLTGVSVAFPLSHYLDERRRRQYLEHERHIYDPCLWFLIGDTLGWNRWNGLERACAAAQTPPDGRPYVRTLPGYPLARAVAPIVVDQQVIGELITHPPVLLADEDHPAWHREFADEHQIGWATYQEAIEHSVRMSRGQLEGAAGLLGIIANTVVSLTQHTIHLEHELAQVRGRQPGQQRHAVARRAVAFMQEHAEEEIDTAAIARSVSLAEAYFRALFAEEIGCSPHEYLIRLRLERAKEYLLHTSMSVTEIAAALCYSRSYFTRLFRRRVGCAPHEYAARRRA
jgi:AraC-like DNA-binding protein